MNLFDQDGGAGGAGDKGAFKIPDLLNAEAITLLNNTDFRDGNLGDWGVYNGGGGIGTLAYDNTDLGGTDNKQALLTSSGDTVLYGWLDTPDDMTLTRYHMHRTTFRGYVPAANTLKELRQFFGSLGGSLSDYSITTIPEDTWTEMLCYTYIHADINGYYYVCFNGDPTDGDKLYFDDISIKPVDVSWIPYGTNLIKIDEDDDCLVITYVDNANGASLLLSDAADLITDLTVGQRYALSFYASVGAGDTVSVQVLGQDGITVLIDSGNIAETRTSYSIQFDASHVDGDRIRLAGMAAGDVLKMDSIILSQIGAKSSMGMGMGMGLTLR